MKHHPALGTDPLNQSAAWPHMLGAGQPRPATRWLDASKHMRRGEKHPTFRIGSGDSDDELAPSLASRAETPLGWADDPEVWEDDGL